MQVINHFTKKIIRHPLAVNVRNLINIRPTYYSQIPHGSSCSDLFLWISDKTWTTQIDLMNISNLCFPNFKTPEQARVLVFDQHGKSIAEDCFVIEPGKVVRVDVSQVAQKSAAEGLGTFAILRKMSVDNPFVSAETCLSERGYASFVNARDNVKQFVHGNSYVLYSNPGQMEGFEFVRSNFHFNKIYRIQTPLNDCDSSECIFLNPTDKVQRVKYIGYDAQNGNVFAGERDLRPLAPDVLSIPREVSRLEAISKVFMLRPVVRKNYGNRSDFFHA